MASYQAAADTINGFHFHPFLPLAATASGKPRLLDFWIEDAAQLQFQHRCCMNSAGNVCTWKGYEDAMQLIALNKSVCIQATGGFQFWHLTQAQKQTVTAQESKVRAQWLCTASRPPRAQECST